MKLQRSQGCRQRLVKGAAAVGVHTLDSCEVLQSAMLRDRILSKHEQTICIQQLHPFVTCTASTELDVLEAYRHAFEALPRWCARKLGLALEAGGTQCWMCNGVYQMLAT